MRLGYGVHALCPLHVCTSLSSKYINTGEAGSVSPTSKILTHLHAPKETGKRFLLFPLLLTSYLIKRTKYIWAKSHPAF